VANAIEGETMLFTVLNDRVIKIKTTKETLEKITRRGDLTTTVNLSDVNPLGGGWYWIVARQNHPDSVMQDLMALEAVNA
jgi:hypothetical protein